MLHCYCYIFLQAFVTGETFESSSMTMVDNSKNKIKLKKEDNNNNNNNSKSNADRKSELSSSKTISTKDSPDNASEISEEDLSERESSSIGKP